MRRAGARVLPAVRRWSLPVSLLTSLLTCVVAGLVGSATPAGAAHDTAARPGQVLIVTAPRLTWGTVERLRPPELTAFFGRAAVANCSIRSAGSRTPPGAGYLTLGAGNRMATTSGADGTVVERDEDLPIGSPADVYEQRTGEPAAGPILALDEVDLDRRNAAERFGGEPGALASALAHGDRSVAVVGNADHGRDDPRRRQVGLAAMDRRGVVSGGAVSDRLLVDDTNAPYGVSLDDDAVLGAFDRAWREHDVVIVELSDLERAAGPEAAAGSYRRALERSDDLFVALLGRVTADDTVIVLGPTPPVVETQLTVFGMTGPGVGAGWATSSTTRREGYVALTDVAPTVVDRFGLDVPSSMTDTRLSTRAAGGAFEERLDRLVDQAHRALVRDRTFGPLTTVFVVTVVIEAALASWCIARAPRWAPVVRAIGLVILSVPPVTFLLGIWSFPSAPVLGLAVAVAAAALAALAALTWRRDRHLPPLVPVALLWAVLAVDIVLGGELQMSTVFGYSPIVAGRFAGYGNQAFSMIALSSLWLAAAAVDRLARPADARPRALMAAVAAWFAVTVVLDGHPALGSDVGGVLAFVPAAAVAFCLLFRLRVKLRWVVVTGVATVGALALFAAIDLGRPAEDRTHLGRFVDTVRDGGAVKVIGRKLSANIDALSSVWTWVIPVAMAYFAYLTWRPNHTMHRLASNHGRFREFGAAAVVLGFFAMVTNDSGVSMPAMMVALVAAYVSYLVVDPADLAADQAAELTADEAAELTADEAAEGEVPW